MIYGFGCGYFGRDSYNDKRVEAVGADWVVVREVDGGQVGFASFAEHEVTRVVDQIRQSSAQEKKERR